jgi:pSer/pThr/pTyr-binding forkhead associated (FHA) protein
MYRLTVVAGPTRGATYTLKDGENGVGRLEENAISLQSAKVSKRHCVLVASDGELLVRDQGSSNGTFVNGVLTRERKIAAGDRVSVGEFVFEVSEHGARKRGNLSLAYPPTATAAVPTFNPLVPDAAIPGASSLPRSRSGARYKSLS